MNIAGGGLTRLLDRWRLRNAMDGPPLPVQFGSWGYVPMKPYWIVDTDPVADVVLGLASTSSLNTACAAFAERLDVHPVQFLHAVIDSRGVIVLGAQPDPKQQYAGCAAAWLLMDRYIDPIKAAICETWAKEQGPG